MPISQKKIAEAERTKQNIENYKKKQANKGFLEKAKDGFSLDKRHFSAATKQSKIGIRTSSKPTPTVADSLKKIVDKRTEEKKDYKESYKNVRNL